jgi:hypothetical protein
MKTIMAKENKLVIPKVDPAPEGYKKKTTDLVGFWNMEKGAVHFTPKFARVFDSDIDPTKPSILLIGDAVGGNPINIKTDKKDADGKMVLKEGTAKDGDAIGVWYKPGMSPVKDLANVKVYMYVIGELDTGKPNKMVTFDVLSKSDGQTLFITEDYRKHSTHVSLPFPVKGKESAASRATDDDEDFGNPL